jgi:hypothetical protein
LRCKQSRKCLRFCSSRSASWLPPAAASLLNRTSFFFVSSFSLAL